MNVEQTLTQELVTVARAVETPAPPAVAALLEQAGRARTRTRARVAATSLLAAAAVLAAIVAGTRLDHPAAAPSPTHPTTSATNGPLPTGAPPRLAYVSGGTLYLDGKAQPGTWGTAQTVGRTSAATIGRADAPKVVVTTLVLFRDDREVARIDNVVRLGAVVSKDGSKVAWVELNDDDTADLVERDMTTGREVGRIRVERRPLSHEGEENESWENLRDVSDDGTVTYGGVIVTHVWRPGSAPVDHQPALRWEGTEGFPRSVEPVAMSADGAWGAWTTDSNGRTLPDDGSAWTPDGVTFQHPGETGSRFTIALPPGSEAGTVTWETATQVLVPVFDDPDYETRHYLRCSTTTRGCELAPPSYTG
jgi:hypothetical protein